MSENQIQIPEGINLTENQINLKKANNVIRALNHKLRQEILKLLNEGELTVTEIYTKLRTEQSVASQHLAILRNEGIILAVRNGKFIRYKVNVERIKKIDSLCEEMATKVKDYQESEY